jgi:hypothetical protein
MISWEELKLFLKGKVFLAVFTFVDKDKNTIEKYQTSGTVYELSDDAVIGLHRSGKSVFQIPYESENIVKAPPGDYPETETGRLITNPDYVARYTITINDLSEIDKIKELGQGI